jgi:4-carboxymuconolactone decarboxylase
VVEKHSTVLNARMLMRLHSAYCGMPAGLEAFRVADRVLNEMAEKGEMVRG